MGASGSELMATTVSASCMPTVNCMAPLTPQTMASFGRVTYPVRPIIASRATPPRRLVRGRADIDALDARLAPLVARGTGEDTGANGGHLGPVPGAHYACQDAAAESGHLGPEEGGPV